MRIWDEITSPGFCLPFARIMVNNLRDAQICEIYQPIPGQALSFSPGIPSFWPTLRFSSFLPHCAVPTGIPSLSTPSLVLPCTLPFSCLSFLFPWGGPCSGPYSLTMYPWGGSYLVPWSLKNSLIFWDTLNIPCAVLTRERILEKIFSTSPLLVKFSQSDPPCKRSEHVCQNMFNH